MLAPNVLSLVEKRYGPHSVDLMSLDSNAMRDKHGDPLRHFTPYPTPLSTGVNVFAQKIETEANPYVFPPFELIFPLIKFLKSMGVNSCTMVKPLLFPKPIWWPFILSCMQDRVLLGEKGNKKILLVPSKQGFDEDRRGLTWDLIA